MERPIELSGETVWSDVSARLQDALSDGTYKLLFADAEGAEQEGVFEVTVPNDFTRERIEESFRGLLEAAVHDAAGEDRLVRIAVRDEVEPAGAPAVPSPSPLPLNPR